MGSYEGLSKQFEPNWQGLVDNILRKGTPDRAYHMELFHDREIRDAIAERFGLMKGVDASDADYERRKLIAVNRFCGWDTVNVGLVGVGMEFHRAAVKDTADLQRAGGRAYQDEHTGPIMNG